MTQEHKKEFINCLNPLAWMKGLYISFVSIFAVISHYFVFLLVVLLIALLSFFAYDRYMFYTYGPDGKYQGPFQSKPTIEQKNTSQPAPIEEKIILEETTQHTHKETEEIQESDLRPIHSSIQEEVNRRLGKTPKKHKKDQK